MVAFLGIFNISANDHPSSKDVSETPSLSSRKVECGGVNYTVYYDDLGYDIYVVFRNTNSFSVDVEYEIYGRLGFTNEKCIADGTCSISVNGSYKVYLPKYSCGKGKAKVYKTAYRYIY